jgi:hypothetical protein
MMKIVNLLSSSREKVDSQSAAVVRGDTSVE